MQHLLNKAKALLKLVPEEDLQATYHEVLEGTQLKGHNFFILGFAMVIACVGLNVDNNSAIIGAMLISPLMGPIAGFAFGMGIQDAALKKRSIVNWLYMTLISLASSVLYFLLSPFHFDTAQLHAFESATIFDIALAFFGGMAGFIGLVKKDGNKVLAGVAVATACMPPLCTAGYGIAHGNVGYALGGLYFYLINCLFIGIATFLLTRVSGLPLRLQHIKQQGKMVQWLWVILIIAMLLPSLYLARQKWQAQIATATVPTTQQQLDELRQRIETLEAQDGIKPQPMRDAAEK